MDQFLNLSGFVRALRTIPWWQVTIELLLIGLAVFWIIRFLRGTRGARLLKGIAVVLISLYIIVRLLGQQFGLERIEFLPAIFILMRLSRSLLFSKPEPDVYIVIGRGYASFRSWSQQMDEEIDALVESAAYCSRRKIGALIAIERDTPLGSLAEESKGTRINGEISAALLNTIFFPNTELHDVGVIIIQGHLAYAGVQFPMAEGGELERELGARHRAAVGLSQETDAVVLVVSEESGD